MDAFVKDRAFGSRRKVLERALELLEAFGKFDVRELLETFETRRSLMELFNFVMVSGELIDGLAKVAAGRSTLEVFFEKLRDSSFNQASVAKKVLARKRVNSFSDLSKTISNCHEDLNLIGTPQIHEDQQRVHATVNAFKTVPEITSEFLDTFLEAEGYTFDLTLEDSTNPIISITWIPPENYPQVKERKKKRLESRRTALLREKQSLSAR